MIAHPRRTRDESGFTLIELLVVMLIIGILAAIAIPILTRQRESAVDASMKSDLRNAAVMVETYLLENGAYPAAWADISAMVKFDDDTTLTLDVDSDGGAYCLVATRVAGAQSGTGVWSYDSNNGGLLADHGACT